MQRRIARLALPALAVAALLLAASPSFAQFRGNRGGFGGWGLGGSNWGGSNWGGSNWGGGFYGPGYGYGSGYYGQPGYGWGSGYYGHPGTFMTPGYSAQPYVYGAPGYDQGYSTVMPSAGYQSFYPPGGTFQGQAPQDNSRAYIHVRVPANAQVMFDGTPTQQTGTDRTFQTPPLQVNQNYTYEISASWMDNGQQRKQTRTVHMTPGQTVNVDFMSPQGNQSQFQQKQPVHQPGTPGLNPGTTPGVTPVTPSKTGTPPRDVP